MLMISFKSAWAVISHRKHLLMTIIFVSLSDPIDSIMLLADQACQKSPMRRSGSGQVGAGLMSTSGRHSPPPTFETTGGSMGGTSGGGGGGGNVGGMSTLLQYGSYFNTGSPLNGGANMNRVSNNYLALRFIK